ncbi:MAG: DUF2179 domain-containing protein [Bacteroidales bacterium]|nr:DUF2179 domain-containing protein [Bacteroidales bacterium]
MDLSIFQADSWVFVWIILPLLIFFSRIADQSIGTLRLIFVSKGYKYYAPILGFFEVIIWLLAVSQILKQMDNFLYYIAYGAGFAAGNFIGIILEERISLGTVIVRIMPKLDATDLIAYLKDNNYGLTLMDAEGSRGPVKIIFLIIPRKQVKELVSIINRFNPNAFYSIEDVKSVKHGIIRQDNPVFWKPKVPQLWRKSK